MVEKLILLLILALNTNNFQIGQQKSIKSVQAEFIWQNKNKLILNFQCLNCQKSGFQFIFKYFPQQWQIDGNKIVIQEFQVIKSQYFGRDIIFNVEIYSNHRLIFQQTLNLKILDSDIYLQSINNLIKQSRSTIPNTIITDPNLNQISISSSAQKKNKQHRILQSVPVWQQLLSQSQSQSVAQLTPSAQLQSQQNGLSRSSLTTSMQGQGSAEIGQAKFNFSSGASSSKTNLNNNNNSDVISNQTVSPFKLQKQIAVNRQAQANKTVQNVLILYQKIRDDYTKQSNQINSMQIRVNDLRSATNKCAQQLYTLQNTKTKIQNALVDKKSKLPATQSLQKQLSKQSQLQEQQKKLQQQSTRVAAVLEELQKDLEQCRNKAVQTVSTNGNASSGTQAVEDARARFVRNQAEIIRINGEVKDDKTKLGAINAELATVKSKIESLENQLRLARQSQSTLSQQKNKTQQSIISKSNQITSLNLQMRNPNTPRPTPATNSNNSSSRCTAQQQKLKSAQNDTSTIRQKLRRVADQIESQRKTVEAVNGGLRAGVGVSMGMGLDMEIQLLEAELKRFQDNIQTTSDICNENMKLYTNSAIDFNSRQSSLQLLKQNFSLINSQLTKSQRELDLANNNLVNIMKLQFNYFNQNQMKGTLPTIPRSTSRSTNTSMFVSPDIVKLLEGDERRGQTQGQNEGQSLREGARSPKEDVGSFGGVARIVNDSLKDIVERGFGGYMGGTNTQRGTGIAGSVSITNPNSIINSTSIKNNSSVSLNSTVSINSNLIPNINVSTNNTNSLIVSGSIDNSKSTNINTNIANISTGIPSTVVTPLKAIIQPTIGRQSTQVTKTVVSTKQSLVNPATFNNFSTNSTLTATPAAGSTSTSTFTFTTITTSTPAPAVTLNPSPAPNPTLSPIPTSPSTSTTITSSASSINSSIALSTPFVDTNSNINISRNDTQVFNVGKVDVNTSANFRDSSNSNIGSRVEERVAMGLLQTNNINSIASGNSNTITYILANNITIPVNSSINSTNSDAGTISRNINIQNNINISRNVNNNTDIKNVSAPQSDQKSISITSSISTPQLQSVAQSQPQPQPQSQPQFQNPQQLGAQFTLLSQKASQKQLKLANLPQFLKKLKIYIPNQTSPAQTSSLYTLDSQTLQKLGVSNSGSSYSSFKCGNASLWDFGVIQQIGVEYVIVRSKSTMYRLTLSQCTKVAAMQQTDPLKEGNTVYFNGVSVVSLPNNILLNAYLVVSVLP